MDTNVTFTTNCFILHNPKSVCCFLIQSVSFLTHYIHKIPPKQHTKFESAIHLVTDYLRPFYVEVNSIFMVFRTDKGQFISIIFVFEFICFNSY